jgi:hypothetical protein
VVAAAVTGGSALALLACGRYCAATGGAAFSLLACGRYCSATAGTAFTLLACGRWSLLLACGRSLWAGLSSWQWMENLARQCLKIWISLNL